MEGDKLFCSGLEGVIVAETAISHVDGPNGRLIYRGGIPIEALVGRTYEEIVHLLVRGVLPAPSVTAIFQAELAAKRPLNNAARTAFSGLSSATDPMDVLRTLLSAQGADRTFGPIDLNEVLAITAVAPTAIAAFHRRRLGKPAIAPREDLGHVANFLYMLHGKLPKPDQVAWLETYFVVTADHALSPSTFTAQIVGSTGSDLWSAVVAAVGALKGPAHGGATIGATQLVRHASKSLDIEEFVQDKFERRERFMGFGHREYRKYDPRAKILARVCMIANPEYFRVATSLERIVLRELAERYPERPNFTNMDFFAGGVLEAAGIPEAFFPCVFAAARSVGWAMHVVEYVAGGHRIVSPASRWIGPVSSVRQEKEP